MKRNDAAGSGLFQHYHEGRVITGGPETTPGNVKIAVKALLRVSRAKRANQRVVHVPGEALAAVGVTSADELEVAVPDRELVLGPTD